MGAQCDAAAVSLYTYVYALCTQACCDAARFQREGWGAPIEVKYQLYRSIKRAEGGVPLQLIMLADKTGPGKHASLLPLPHVCVPIESKGIQQRHKTSTGVGVIRLRVHDVPYNLLHQYPPPKLDHLWARP